MSLTARTYERAVGFTPMTDDELFYVNGGSGESLTIGVPGFSYDIINGVVYVGGEISIGGVVKIGATKAYTIQEFNSMMSKIGLSAKNESYSAQKQFSGYTTDSITGSWVSSSC
jgi:hypothetical protein